MSKRDLIEGWTVRYRHGKYRYGTRMVQSRMTFPAKRKKGCRLASASQIRNSIGQTTTMTNVACLAFAMPKIPLPNTLTV